MKNLSEDARRTVRRVRRTIKAEGLQVAYDALIAVAKDSKAQASARATAGVAIFRAAGLFEKAQDPDDQEPQEATVEELREQREYLQAMLKEARELSELNQLNQRNQLNEDDDDDLFA
ncbi:MAG: hypothetical protein QOH65_1067 [Methylobacteriaceae bacterium]|jgi:hypothetical protein|nr:hypothetical protein [Methylobacteriaceae bacterium]